MNRHQIGYIYGELVELWDSKFNAHIETIKESDEYKELYDAFGDTKTGKADAKNRVNTIKETIEIATFLEKLLEMNDNFYIGEKGTYTYSTKSSIDSSAREYLKDKVKYVKEFDETTKVNLEHNSNYYALSELKIYNSWQFREQAAIKMKAQLALMPIGEHDNIIKTVLEKVTIEKVIEFVNA